MSKRFGLTTMGATWSGTPREEEGGLVALSLIRPQGLNPRTRYATPEAVAAMFVDDETHRLAASIREVGLLNPLTVRRAEDGFELIAGERRYHACHLAEQLEVPVRVVEADDAAAFEIALTENTQRRDLDVVAETLGGFDLLAMRSGLSREAVRAELGRVRRGGPDAHGFAEAIERVYGQTLGTWAQLRSRVLDLDDSELGAVREGLALRAAFQLLRLSPSDRARVLGRWAAERARSGEWISAPEAKDQVDARLRRPEEPLKRMRRQMADYTRQLNRADPNTRTRAEEVLARALSEVEDLLSSSARRGASAPTRRAERPD